MSRQNRLSDAEFFVGHRFSLIFYPQITQIINKSFVFKGFLINGFKKVTSKFLVRLALFMFILIFQILVVQICHDGFYLLSPSR
jgi:hypothetical protein